MLTARVLVVNGTGFIGTWVVRALHTLGHAVTVYHRGEHEPDLPASVRHVRSPNAAIPVVAYPNSFRHERYDAVILMVPIGEADAAAAVRAFAGRTERLVAISSGDVYAAYGRLTGKERPTTTGSDVAPASHATPSAERPATSASQLSEDAPLRSTLYPYGRRTDGPYGALVDYDKILVEKVVLDAGQALPATVIRLPKVYGPGDSRGWFGQWVQRMDDRRPVLLLGERQARWRWTHGYVEDVAAGIARAALHPAAAGRVYNLGEAHTPTVAARVLQIAEAAGWAGEMRVLPEDCLPPHLREPVSYMEPLVLDTTRARRELGYEEVATPETALRRTVASIRMSAPPSAANPAGARAEYAAEDSAMSGATLLSRVGTTPD